MNILSIETVLGKCSVALQYKGIEDFLISRKNFVQSEMLFVLIETLLHKHKIKYENFDFLSCTIGPGSFTGIRAGITAVKTIQTLLPHIQAFGFNTLEVMAFASLPIKNMPAAVTLKHGQKFYLNDVDQNGHLIGQTTTTNQIDYEKYKTLITTDAHLDAMTVLNFTKAIIKTGIENLYDKISPIYISEPNITT